MIDQFIDFVIRPSRAEETPLPCVIYCHGNRYGSKAIVNSFKTFSRYVPVILEYLGGYVLMQEKLPNYVVPDLTDFKVEELLVKIKEIEVARWREACELEVEAGKKEVEEYDKVVQTYCCQYCTILDQLLSYS
ncbi:hypothetical protein PTKIN_Ptkin17bG0061100 [Pterospermum kingtungense]